MHISVQKDSTTIAKALYKQDDELIRMPDGYLTTPLYYAVELRSAKMVSFLLNRDVELSGQNGDSKTPLHAAVEQQLGELLESLIKAYHNVDLNKKDHSGRTPLIYAVEQNLSDLVKILLRHKADVDRRDTDGRTALHIAVYYDAVDLANVILNHKPSPDLTITNVEGYSIIDLVKHKGRNSRMYALFNRHGCLYNPNLRRSSTTLERPVRPSKTSSKAFGYVDSAYGTASHGRDNEIFALQSNFIKRIDSTGEDKADAESVSSTFSTATSVMQTYLQDLADDLFHAIHTLQTSMKRLQRLCKVHEQLLQQFAYRIGIEFSSGEVQEILYFVHRYRRLAPEFTELN